MSYLVSAYTDVGIRKKTNQDSVLIQVAQTSLGDIAFGVMCDGMGGLVKGELASATLIRSFSEWFQNEFPEILRRGFSQQALYAHWRNLILTQARKIGDYGDSQGVSLGTTVAAVLVMQDKYYAVNVGDSRVYQIHENLIQITKDQTYVQREMDAGRMTAEQAKTDLQRNVLLQCVGASDYIEPDFFSGVVRTDDVFMLCSDGFRHVITPEEIYQYLNPAALLTEQNMVENTKYLTDLNKYRMENDNITVALIKVC